LKNFFIIHTNDPNQYKDQIIHFWEEYLNGTPPERVKWLSHGNPAGKTIWILSILKEKNKLIGLVSLLPKEIFLNGKKYLGAIMGDLIVHRDYRVFGPTLSLLKEAAKSISVDNFDFIYTIPNSDAIKIIQRAGFKNIININTFVRPVIAEYYLNKHLPIFFAKIISILIESFLFIFTKHTYSLPKGIIDENAVIDESFDRLWEKNKNLLINIVSGRSVEQLRWRYNKNPLCNFKIITYKESKSVELGGYIIYSTCDKKIKIYDIFSLKEKYKVQMMKAILKTARKERCKGIYYARSVEINKQYPLKEYGFISSQNNMQLYWSAIQGLSLELWDFVEGDRNI